MLTTDEERAQSRELIRRLLFDRDLDGLTLAELSRRSGVPAGTLGGWVSRLRREAQAEADPSPAVDAAQFVELIPSAGDSEVTSTRFEVVLKSERRVVVPHSFDESALARLVRVLERC